MTNLFYVFCFLAPFIRIVFHIFQVFQKIFFATYYVVKVGFLPYIISILSVAVSFEKRNKLWNLCVCRVWRLRHTIIVDDSDQYMYMIRHNYISVYFYVFIFTLKIFLSNKTEFRHSRLRFVINAEPYFDFA